MSLNPSLTFKMRTYQGRVFTPQDILGLQGCYNGATHARKLCTQCRRSMPPKIGADLRAR